MVIKRFEDIQAWQEARALRKLVYAATRTPVFGRDGRLCGQIESAAVSVMANIAEGFDGGTDIEFARFLQIAFRSATEVQSHSYAALDE
ncbi:MAG: four helix bundle protein [Chloroflexi bacterium]|nr:four helix bundle protein [Chloroflexota bacterium]